MENNFDGNVFNIGQLIIINIGDTSQPPKVAEPPQPPPPQPPKPSFSWKTALENVGIIKKVLPLSLLLHWFWKGLEHVFHWIKDLFVSAG